METTNSAIFEAINENKFEIVKSLLENGVVSPNKKNWNGISLLNYACIFDRLEIVELLLINKADPNMQSNAWIMKSSLLRNPNVKSHMEFVTPLIYASKLNNIKIMKLLIDYGCEPNLTNSNGESAFDYEGGNFIREYLESNNYQTILK